MNIFCGLVFLALFFIIFPSFEFLGIKSYKEDDKFLGIWMGMSGFFIGIICLFASWYFYARGIK